MVRIQISDREAILLKKILYKISKSYLIKDNYIYLYKEYIEIIIESIGDYFIKYGLKKNDEPNALGLEIEELQDKFLRIL